ncbi:hypothetical protein ACFXP3_06635 [Streptomyces sp. NPDC059096]|uniref:hypothetical protein n=1 Tax=Streptomyces sp. NPDC059096 TaxID=3346727 RepID=UPI0036A6E4B6
MANVQSDELVILVHGTFAGDKDERDEGTRWWQRGSATWEALAAVLPEGAALPDEEVRLFHWSGANAQSQRLKGSTELLELLLGLEEQGRSYHLVGHSHGGSVIWETLVSAQIVTEGKGIPRSLTSHRGKQHVQDHARLPGLRSVTTVGTPFLILLPRLTWLVRGWRHPRYTLFGDLSRSRLGDTLVGFAVSLMMLIGLPGIVLGVPAFFVLALSMLSVLHMPLVEGLSVGVLGLAVLGMLAFGPVNRLEFTDGLTRRAGASRQVFERFAGRWLGLWAPDDEAIALLKGVAVPRAPSYTWFWQRPQEREPWEPANKEVPAQRIPVRIGNPISGTGMIPDVAFWNLTHVVRPPLRSAFNRWVGPRLSDWISRTLLHTVQGNDLPLTSLVYAAPWPLPLDRLPPGLPEALATRLTEHANSNSAQLAPAIRQILAQAALDGLSLPQAAATGQRPRTDGALVHTSYFDDPELLRLIALHIERHLTVSPVKSPAEFTDVPAEERALRNWLDENAEAVQQRLAEFHSAVGSDVEQGPTMPRQRAASRESVTDG